MQADHIKPVDLAILKWTTDSVDLTAQDDIFILFNTFNGNLNIIKMTSIRYCPWRFRHFPKISAIIPADNGR
jgi:hypothetical protein